MDTKFMELVKQFPLLPITNEDEHKAAKDMILLLTARDGELSLVEVGYGKVLVRLIQSYESSTGSI
jgi:hypothetical protein